MASHRRSRAQTVAIVAAYWRKGWSVKDTAVKVGLSERQVFGIYLHVAATEGEQLVDPVISYRGFTRQYA